jgi:hypothetical protein
MGIGLDSARNLKYKPASTREARATIPAATEAACVALLNNKRTTRAIADELHISPASVYAIRDRNGIVTNRRKKRHLMADQDTRKGLASCRCGLTLFTEEEQTQGHCNNCLPTSAVGFIGRAGESRGSLVLPRPF